MKNARRVFMVLVVSGLASIAQGGAFSDDFEGYGPLSDSQMTPISGQNGWVNSAVDGSTNYAANVTGNWGGPHSGAGTGGVDALVMADSGYNHVAHSIGDLSVGDQVSVMFNVHANWVFGEIWVGLDTLVDNAVSANNETAMVLQMGAGGSGISYGMYQQQSGWTLGNPSQSAGGTLSGPDGLSSGELGRWTEVRMTMLNLGGNTTWGIDSATIETRNITQWDSGNTTGAWVNLGNMNLNPAGIGDGDQAANSQEIFVGLGGEGVHFDNLLITPEPMTMSLLGLGALAALRRRRRS